MDIQFRPATDADLPRLHEINEASTPGVGTITEVALSDLMHMSPLTLVAESGDAVVGFVLCLVEGADYRSPNYAWLSGKYRKFAYVDRIAVAPEVRSNGLGAELYQAVFDHFSPDQEVLLAEVNLEPPNPGSVRFHQRMGFSEIGQRWDDDHDKGVVYVEKPLS